jgi:YYY domain-containing protein
VIDERIELPPSARLWHARRFWMLAGALGAVGVLALVVVRVGSKKLMLAPGVAHVQAAHGTWRHMFDLHGVAASIPLPLWMLALVGASALGFPYAWLAARSLPDRGYGLARVLGLLLVTWSVWWLASLRLLRFTRLAIWLAVAIVAAGAVAIVLTHRAELRAWVRANRRLILTHEALFWALFGAALFVRWSNPDLWHPTRGGEKPMDFAYLNAVTKSSYFPPYDPWFGGGQMNYYYFAFVQVASLIKLTGIPPAIAYNLAIPMLVGLLGSAAFSAALGLVSTSDTLKRGRTVGFAALGALLVTVLGNLGEIRVIRIWLHGTVANDWWFWNPTRVIHPGPGEPGPISEFPAFTYIYGDLHAHAMALPFAACALALVIAVVRDDRSLTRARLRLALLALVLGALWVTNTWDLPTYALIAACGLAIVALRLPRTLRTLVSLVVAVAAVVAVAYLAYLPFHLHYSSVFHGFERWHGRRSRFNDYLTIHGVFLFAIVSGFVVQLAFARDLGSVAREYRLGVRSWGRFARFRRLRRVLVRPSTLHRVGLRLVPAAVLFAAVCAILSQGPEALAVVLAALAVLAWPLPGRRRETTLAVSLRRLTIALVLIGLALTIAVEYYVLRAIDIGRTNTVFKFYLQVWVLWAISTAASAAVVYEHLPRVRRVVRESWRLAFVLLLAVASLYPVLAARAKIQDRFDTSVGRTLDGTAFMKKAVFTDKGVAMPLVYDRDAIFWMLEHVNGSPIVAEVNTAPVLYGWELRYAMFTGNPAIIGWDYHQRQQRPSQSDQVGGRVKDVQEAYTTTDPSVAYRILTHYHASYVVVGPLERAYFPSGAAKWAEGAPRFWRLVYTNPGVQIYRLTS